MAYHQLSIETKQSYINRLEEHRKETAAARMVSKKDVSKHFGKAMATLRPEVCHCGSPYACLCTRTALTSIQIHGLSQRTGCEYLALFVHGNALDSYGGEVLCSLRLPRPASISSSRLQLKCLSRLKLSAWLVWEVCTH